MADSEEVKEVNVKGVVVESTAEVTQEKQGSKCCVCCCDFRRAVVVISIIGVVYYAILLVLTLTGASVGIVGATFVVSDLDDENAQEVAEDVGTVAEVALGVIAIGLAVSLSFFIFQLVAALKFNMYMLVTSLVFTLLTLAYSTWGMIAVATNGNGSLLTAVVSNIVISVVVFIYPLVGLIKEIKAGTMSEETYPREAYSCCCMPDAAV